MAHIVHCATYFFKLKGSVQESHKHLRCSCSPYDFRALHNDFEILVTLNYYFIIFKHGKVSNTAFIYLSGFKFSFATGKYHLNAFVLYIFTTSLTLK